MSDKTLIWERILTLKPVAKALAEAEKILEEK